MSETLTYDPGTDTVTEGDALTPTEQESLEVGEALEQSQDKLLAGKYEDAQALEKAYIELQKKLGENGEEPVSEQEPEAVQEEETPTEYSPAAELITSASDEYWENGEQLSQETIDKFSSMSSQDLVQAYIEVTKNNPDMVNAEPADISDATVNEIKNYAGGEQAYNQMVGWASNNLDQASIQAFDNVVNTGSADAIKFAVNGLRAQYDAANGYEGTMLTGRAPSSSKDIFKSQAELVRAMSDRRYDNDPAYRQDIMEKLNRSDNLQF